MHGFGAVPQCLTSLFLFTFLFFSAFISFFIFFLVGRTAERKDGVYLILLRWHTSLGSDKGSPVERHLFKSVHVHSEWGAGRGAKIQGDNLSGEAERTALHPVSQLHRMRDFLCTLID